MRKKEVISYIERELKRGFKIEDIKFALLEGGHELEDVEDSIKQMMLKKKSSYALAAILIIIIFVGGFFVFNNIKDKSLISETKDKEEYKEVVQEEKKAKDMNLVGAAIYKNALLSEDISICEGIKGNEQLKASCLQRVEAKKNIPEPTEEEKADAQSYKEAVKTKKEELCEKIENKNLKKSCLVRLLKAEEKEKEPEPTQEQVSDAVLYKQAIIEKDSDKCNEITGESLKNSCLGRLEA